MGVDTSTASGILKRIYHDGEIENLQNMETETLKKIKKSPKKPSGAGFYFPVLLEGNQRGQGSQNELEALRTPAQQTVQQGTVSPKVFTHTIRYSGLAMAIAQGNEDSFADIVTFNSDNGMKDSMKEENAQLFRSGLGRIAQVNGAVSASATITFDNGVPTHFREGMYVDIFNGSTKEVDSVKISDASAAASSNTITLESAVTCSDNAYIYRENVNDNAASDGKELTGFPMIVDDGSLSSTYEGINRSTYPKWKGISIPAGSVNISNDLLQRAVSRLKIQGGKKANKVLSNTSQFRKYLDVLTPIKRFNDKSKMDSGYEEVPTWNGLEWIEDTDCPFDTIYIADLSGVEKYEVKALNFADDDGLTLRWDSGYDAYVSYIKHYMNIGTRDPRCMVAITGLSTPIY